MKREILTWTDSNKEVLCKKEEPENGVYEYTYEIPESEKEETLWLEWYEDVANTVGCWYPDCDLGERMGLTGRDAARHRCQFLLRCIASMIRAAITVLR